MYSSNHGSNPEWGNFLGALCSGAAPNLEHIYLSRAYPQRGPRLGHVTLLPNSLPRLRRMSVCFSFTDETLAALLAAAGPRLTELTICFPPTTAAAVRLMASRDFPWMPSLRKLELAWSDSNCKFEVPGWTDDSAALVVSLLARTPGLRKLHLQPPALDELLVRLLALIEGGGLPCLRELDVLPYGEARLSPGALLLLLLWRKRAARKAGEGQEPGPGAALELKGLPFRSTPPLLSEVTKQCLAQIKAAVGGTV
jgi:hypothetical protein